MSQGQRWRRRSRKWIVILGVAALLGPSHGFAAPPASAEELVQLLIKLQLEDAFLRPNPPSRRELRAMFGAKDVSIRAESWGKATTGTGHFRLYKAALRGWTFDPQPKLTARQRRASALSPPMTLEISISQDGHAATAEAVLSDSGWPKLDFGPTKQRALVQGYFITQADLFQLMLHGNRPADLEFYCSTGNTERSGSFATAGLERITREFRTFSSFKPGEPALNPERVTSRVIANASVPGWRFVTPDKYMAERASRMEISGEATVSCVRGPAHLEDCQLVRVSPEGFGFEHVAEGVASGAAATTGAPPLGTRVEVTARQMVERDRGICTRRPQ